MRYVLHIQQDNPEIPIISRLYPAATTADTFISKPASRRICLPVTLCCDNHLKQLLKRLTEEAGGAGVSVEARADGEHLPSVCCHQGSYTAGGACLLCNSAKLTDSASTALLCFWPQCPDILIAPALCDCQHRPLSIANPSSILSVCCSLMHHATASRHSSCTNSRVCCMLRSRECKLFK